MTKPILDPLKIQWKDFAARGHDCCWERVSAVRFGGVTRLTGPHSRSESRVYNKLPSAPPTPHFAGVSPDLAPIENSNPIFFRIFIRFPDNRPIRPKYLVLACQSPSWYPSTVS